MFYAEFHLTKLKFENSWPRCFLSFLPDLTIYGSVRQIIHRNRQLSPSGYCPLNHADPEVAGGFTPLPWSQDYKFVSAK